MEVSRGVGRLDPLSLLVRSAACRGLVSWSRAQLGVSLEVMYCTVKATETLEQTCTRGRPRQNNRPPCSEIRKGVAVASEL